MFTGITEEMGTVIRIDKKEGFFRLSLSGKIIFGDLKIGDSVSVNGVCLTAAEIKNDSFTADVMDITMQRSSLGKLISGERVNLERAMPASGRFGGHIVSGHIDCTCRILSISKKGNSLIFEIGTKPEDMRYIVERGSIAVDGISLTVAETSESSFKVSLIPHTLEETTMHYRKPGDIVNIEWDIIGKYVEKLMQSEKKKKGITEEFLMENGFLAKGEKNV